MKKRKSKPEPRKRSTQAEMLFRVNKIAELLISGRSRAYILRFCEERYELAQRASDDLISKATDAIMELKGNDLEEARARVLAGYYVQYRKLKNSPEAAAGILDKIAKTHGLYEQTLNVKLNRPLADVSDEELEKAAAELGKVDA